MKRMFFLFLFLLNFPCAFGMEIKSLSVTDAIKWTIETTFGFQNVRNMQISKENGENTQVSQALSFSGVLFHSFWNGIPTFRSSMNLGFTKETHFFWTDFPEFDSEPELNKNLRCIEYDAQIMLPLKILTSRITLSPFVGYSFINYSYGDTFVSSDEAAVLYNILVFGGTFHIKQNKRFSYNCFISYSPIVVDNYRSRSIQSLNYGVEVLANTHPLSVTLFFTQKRLFRQRGRFISEGTNYVFNTSEIGFSMHLNLW